MILSWQHKGQQNFFEKGSKAGIVPEHAKRLKIILQFLDSAIKADDLNLPGMRFHKLKGRLKEYFSVSVSGNWRVIYKFSGNDADNVNYIDYH